MFVFRLEDLDGSVDMVLDLTINGDNKDYVDLRALNLLTSGQTTQTWLLAHSTEGPNHLALDLGSGSLVLQGVAPLAQSLTDLEDSIIM